MSVSLALRVSKTLPITVAERALEPAGILHCVTLMILRSNSKLFEDQSGSIQVLTSKRCGGGIFFAEPSDFMLKGTLKRFTSFLFVQALAAASVYCAEHGWYFSAVWFAVWGLAGVVEAVLDGWNDNRKTI